MKYARHGFSLLLAILISLALALSIAAGTASAHAKVLSATPGIDSTISSVPDKVTVETAENINPDVKLSNLFVYGPSGDLISQGDAKVSLSNPKEMAIDIKPEKEGTYIVRWITVSALDGDPDEGAFYFTVKAAASASTPVAIPTVVTPKVTPSTNNSFPLLPVALTGIIALLAGLGGGFGLGRRANTAKVAETSTKGP